MQLRGLPDSERYRDILDIGFAIMQKRFPGRSTSQVATLGGEPEPMCEPFSMVVFLRLQERLGDLWRFHVEALRMA